MKKGKKIIAMLLTLMMLVTCFSFQVMAGGMCGYGTEDPNDECEFAYRSNESEHWTVCVKHTDENGEHPIVMQPEAHDYDENGHCGCGRDLNAGADDEEDNNDDVVKVDDVVSREILAWLVEISIVTGEMGTETPLVCVPSSDGSKVTIKARENAQEILEEYGFSVELPEVLYTGFDIILTIPEDADLSYTGLPVEPAKVIDPVSDSRMEYLYIVGDIEYTNNVEEGIAKATVTIEDVCNRTEYTLKKTFAIGDAVEIKFSDVEPGSYYEDAIQWAASTGVTTGIGDGKFGPENSCTRGQVVSFIYRGEGSPNVVAANNPFADVAEGAYYYNPVLWAVENGITSGTSAATFSPEKVCTRGQVVTFLWNAAGKPEVSGENTFSDVWNGAYYAKAVKWAVQEGITSGTSETTFSPEDVCTRGQVVTFMYRYYN